MQFLANPLPPSVLVFLAFLVTTFNAAGLFAVWAGLGRAHWFLRIATLVAIVALPLAIPAPELVLLFTLQFTLTTLPLLVYRKFCRPAENRFPAEDNQARPLRRGQIFLRDLILLTFLVAMALAILTQLPKDTWKLWPAVLAWAAGLATITLLAVWIALGWRRLWLSLGANALASSRRARHDRFALCPPERLFRQRPLALAEESPSGQGRRNHAGYVDARSPELCLLPVASSKPSFSNAPRPQPQRFRWLGSHKSGFPQD